MRRWSRGDLAAVALALLLLLLGAVVWTRLPITGFWPGWSCTYAGGEPVCIKDPPKTSP